jgi:hypothetical protein
MGMISALVRDTKKYLRRKDHEKFRVGDRVICTDTSQNTRKIGKIVSIRILRSQPFISIWFDDEAKPQDPAFIPADKISRVEGGVPKEVLAAEAEEREEYPPAPETRKITPTTKKRRYARGLQGA